jgi:hypothetical protein
MSTKLTETSLRTVRQQAAQVIIGLQDGSISPLIADAIYKQSLTIVDSYRVELRAIELAINTSTSGPLSFDKATKLINQLELKTK